MRRTTLIARLRQAALSELACGRESLAHTLDRDADRIEAGDDDLEREVLASHAAKVKLASIAIIRQRGGPGNRPVIRTDSGTRLY